MKTVLLTIWNDKLSDYPVLDYTLKFWTFSLMALWVVGMSMVLYGLLSGEADIQNATFGVFDYL
jgi:hypothetical protein